MAESKGIKRKTTITPLATIWYRAMHYAVDKDISASTLVDMALKKYLDDVGYRVKSK